MNILANSKIFYQHALETNLIGGLFIFLIGLLCGWLIWRHCRAQADRVEALNEALREQHDSLLNKNRKLSQLMKEIPKEPTS